MFTFLHLIHQSVGGKQKTGTYFTGLFEINHKLLALELSQVDYCFNKKGNRRSDGFLCFEIRDSLQEAQNIIQLCPKGGVRVWIGMKY